MNKREFERSCTMYASLNSPEGKLKLHQLSFLSAWNIHHIVLVLFLVFLFWSSVTYILRIDWCFSCISDPACKNWKIHIALSMQTCIVSYRLVFILVSKCLCQGRNEVLFQKPVDEAKRRLVCLPHTWRFQSKNYVNFYHRGSTQNLCCLSLLLAVGDFVFAFYKFLVEGILFALFDDVMKKKDALSRNETGSNYALCNKYKAVWKW